MTRPDHAPSIPALIEDLEEDLGRLAEAIAAEGPEVAARLRDVAAPLAWHVVELAARTRALVIVA